MLVRRKLIRERAEALLDRFDAKKAPVDIELFATKLGLEIVKAPADESSSGFLLRNYSQKVLIGINANHNENKQRFVIAHECGHFLLHEGETLHIDYANSCYQIQLCNKESNAGTNTDETEANLFAMEILMPIRFLTVDLAKVGSISFLDDEKIEKLAKRYKVSQQLLVLRLNHLGYII